MLERIRRMLIKEFLQMFRDVRMRLVVFVAPLIQMTIFAFALTTDVTNIRTIVLDRDNTPSSRELLHAFTAADYFEIVAFARSDEDFRKMLNAGEAQAALEIPLDFERDLRGGRTARVQLLVDGTETNNAAVALSYANQIAGQFAQERQLRQFEVQLGAGAIPATVAFEMRAWFNPNLESAYYYVPGLIAVMLMVVSVMLTSISIVREKEIGTIEQVMVTPIRRVEFIIGKTLPFLVTGYITMTLMFAVAMIVFGVRVEGSILLLYVLAGVYVVGNLGLALFVSVSAATQQQALLTAFLLLMPGVLLSGFMFPIRNMPMLIQYATVLNPMRWFLIILRGIVLKGEGIATLWQPILWQTGLAVIFITLAVARFRKTLS
ncbi:MAG: ABC transporter permease [Candidatus Hydrogenedentes bacterium]|nr:ABC transporter permease [Candidatus Hydrogenedentota bacterium]